MDLYQSLVAVEPATLIVTICNLFIQMYIVKKFLLTRFWLLSTSAVRLPIVR